MLLSLFHLFFCHCTVHIFHFSTTALITGPFDYSLTIRLSHRRSFSSPCLSTTILSYERSAAPFRPVAPHTTYTGPETETLSLAS